MPVILMAISEHLTAEVLFQCYEWIEEIEEPPEGTSGSQGKIFIVLSKVDHCKYCVKFVDITCQHARMHFEEEVRFIKSLSHPNIIPITQSDIIGYANHILGTIITPYIEGGDMCYYLHYLNNGQITCSEVTLLHIMKQLIDVVSYLHSEGVIHHDIKSENILIGNMDDTEPNVYLIDFGYSVQFDGNDIPMCNCPYGTAAYFSPEQNNKPDNSHSFPIDVFQLGWFFTKLLEGSKLSTESGNYSEIEYILQAMIQSIPEDRPSMECIKQYWEIKITNSSDAMEYADLVLD